MSVVDDYVFCYILFCNFKFQLMSWTTNDGRWYNRGFMIDRSRYQTKIGWQSAQQTALRFVSGISCGEQGAAVLSATTLQKSRRIHFWGNENPPIHPRLAFRNPTRYTDGQVNLRSERSNRENESFLVIRRRWHQRFRKWCTRIFAFWESNVFSYHTKDQN